MAADPIAPLTAVQLAQALGVSEDSVLHRERAGKIFSIVRGNNVEREYPAFQAWPGIAGEPLEEVLAALGSLQGAYGFFTSPTDLLDGLSPIEAMLGRLTTLVPMEPEAAQLLCRGKAHRMTAVVAAAQCYRAQTAV